MKKLMRLLIFTLIICLSGAGASAQEDTSGDETDDGCYDLLLIGADRRDESWNGNSDTMILVTVNENREQVYLTSFLRDLYADIPGHGEMKLNAACAIGGPELCVETIKENYKVDIDNYAYVDFNDMIRIVDLLGGIDLEVEENEIEVCNQYIATMCEANQESADEHLIYYSGMQHLDGYQAVGFSRNRYSGSSSDFGRTDRQRKVLYAIADKFRGSDAAEYAKLAPQILTYVKHDLNAVDQINVLLNLTKWMKYDLKQQRIPYDNEWYSRSEILIPVDMEDTIQKIRDAIYG